jgi:hypothetical protein
MGGVSFPNTVGEIAEITYKKERVFWLMVTGMLALGLWQHRTSWREPVVEDPC